MPCQLTDGRNQGRGQCRLGVLRRGLRREIRPGGEPKVRDAKCLTKDRADLPAFYGLPAGHCKHVRPTNPMIRTDPTVRHRTPKTKGCLSRQTALAMTHQLMLSAKRQWRKLDGQNRRPEIIEGTEFGQTASSPRSKPPDHAVTNFRA